MRSEQFAERISIVSLSIWRMSEPLATSNARSDSTRPRHPYSSRKRQGMEITHSLATVDEKADRLRQVLASQPRLLVAYSGGVDSAFLAWSAHQVLGREMCAVIADSPSLARTHLEDALAFTREREIPVDVVETHELENPAYIRNDSERCFHCK